MNEPILKTEIQDQLAVWTINRPEVMNSFNFDLLRALKAAVDQTRLNPNVRVIVITGAGERAFSAGADLKERATMPLEQVKTFAYTIRTLFTEIELLPQPVIAAINGVALGAGTELALATDIRIAADTATLGLPETQLAILPGAGGTQRLPRLVGKGKGKELIFTGRRIAADEALAIGLVNQVCKSDDLMKVCRAMATQICKGGPIAMAQAKYAINYGLETDLQAGLAIELAAYWNTVGTEDRVEALTAFREKRSPVYKGR